MGKEINIINFWYVKNYGACLTAYALYKLFKDFGYEPVLTDNMTQKERILYGKIFNKDFITKYCKTEELKRIFFDSQTQPILTTGSDQVFNPVITQDKTEEFLLDWGNINSKKIAVAASFGVDKETFLKQNSQETIERMKNSLSTFDFISVREKSGINICREIFNVDAKWIVDPVFLVKKATWEELADKGNINSEGKIVSYLFDKSNRHLNVLKNLSEKYKTNIIELDNYKYSPESWLKAIRDCKLFIANSFHGICFAIIFNRPFICLANETGKSARFESLFELLKIEDKSVSLNDINVKDCIYQPNYGVVNQIIELERQSGLEFLKTALKAEITPTEDKIRSNIKVLENTVSDLDKKCNLNYQIKKFIREKWLIMYYCYLPLKIRNVIQFIRYGKTWN